MFKPRYNNNIIILEDDVLEPVEDHEPIVDEDPEDSNHEEGTTQTAEEDIISDSLTSGALSEVCEVMAVMRELVDKENDLVKETGL